MAGATTAAKASVVFKGRMMMLTVLEIRDRDCNRICAEIDQQLARAPDFFAGMPVLLSLPGPFPDLAKLRTRLRKVKLIAVGVLDASEPVAEAAAKAGLGTLSSHGRAATPMPAPDDASRASERDTQPRSESAPAPQPAKSPSQLVTRQVRSGRQIYARGGDLVITTSVSVGAEILADGHIHVYGALRGRAIAGASGDTTARIFCRRFEPELVAIAGCYQVADTMDENVRSQPVVVRLEHENLNIELQE